MLRRRYRPPFNYVDRPVALARVKKQALYYESGKLFLTRDYEVKGFHNTGNSWIEWGKSVRILDQSVIGDIIHIRVRLEGPGA